jgi:hypothetical protein
MDTSDSVRTRWCGGWLGRAIPVLVLFLLVVAACADPTESEEYVSLQTRLDDTTAELNDLRSRLAGAEVALAASRSESQIALDGAERSLAGRNARVGDLETAVAEMLTSLDEIRQAAAVHISGDLFFLPYDSAISNGVAADVGDGLVISLGLPGGTWEGFASDPDRFWCWCRQVEDLDDPATSAALERWFDAPIGSEEEFWAWYEVQMRVMGILIAAIESAQDQGVVTLDGGSG